MFLLQIALLYPIEALLVTGALITLLLFFYGPKLSKSQSPNSNVPQSVGIAISQRVVKKERLVGAVELTEFPEEHLVSKEVDRSKYLPFFNILRVMVLSNFPVGLHDQGYRVGQIIEKLWGKFGRTRRRATIYKVIERNESKRSEKKKGA